jgi:hypothetical protein
MTGGWLGGRAAGAPLWSVQAEGDFDRNADRYRIAIRAGGGFKLPFLDGLDRFLFQSQARSFHNYYPLRSTLGRHYNVKNHSALVFRGLRLWDCTPGLGNDYR